MTLPDTLKYAQGTPIVWGVPGATLMGLAETHDMSLNGLASGSARNGVFADLGADWDRQFAVWVLAETGTAPSAGNMVEVYFAESHSSSVFPGKATGTDAAYSSTPSVATNKLLLGLPFCLIATADGNTELIQNAGLFIPKARYVAPVYINSLGQALRTEATASNNTSGIILMPIVDKIVE